MSRARTTMVGMAAAEIITALGILLGGVAAVLKVLPGCRARSRECAAKASKTEARARQEEAVAKVLAAWAQTEESWGRVAAAEADMREAEARAWRTCAAREEARDGAVAVQARARQVTTAALGAIPEGRG